MPPFTQNQRVQIAEGAIGKTIVNMYYEDADEDNYWVIELSDETEFSFRFMAELVP